MNKLNDLVGIIDVKVSNKENEIKNCNDEKKIKSLSSVLCGIKFDKLIIDSIVSNNFDDLVNRLYDKYNKVELVEVDKKYIIENDLIDKVVIKKVNGENKYFIKK